MNKPQSKTDWVRVKAEAQRNASVPFDSSADPYNPNDAKAVEAFWDGAAMKRAGAVIGTVRRRGPNKRPVKASTTLRLPADTLARWKATGKGWQTRMAAVLEKAL